MVREREIRVSWVPIFSAQLLAIRLEYSAPVGRQPCALRHDEKSRSKQLPKKNGSSVLFCKKPNLIWTPSNTSASLNFGRRKKINGT